MPSFRDALAAENTGRYSMSPVGTGEQILKTLSGGFEHAKKVQEKKLESESEQLKLYSAYREAGYSPDDATQRTQRMMGGTSFIEKLITGQHHNVFNKPESQDKLSLDQEKTRLDMEKTRADIDKTKADTAMTGQGKPRYSNQGELLGYFEDGATFAPDEKEPKDPTAAQETTALYASRLKQANDLIEGMEGYTSDLNPATQALQNVVPNFAKSGERQSYDQAKRNFLTAVLRRESGAVISPTEFAEGNKQYFPQPGDKPQVLAQKKANRDLVAKNFITASRGAYVPYQESAKGGGEAGTLPAAGGYREGQTATSPKTGTKVIFRGGKWQKA